MRFIFRADASTKIGAGHVMRCFAIMEEAISREIECIFVGELNGIDWLEQSLTALGVTCLEDPQKLEIMRQTDVLLLDSYDVQTSDPFIQNHNWKAVVVISDDSTPPYESSLVVHLGINQLKTNVAGAVYLSGPSYFPFRKSIQKRRNLNLEEISNIVIFGGGVDAYDFALNLANKLKFIRGFSRAVFISNLSSEISSLDSRFSTRNRGSALDDELRNADLVFTTASVSSFEIIAMEIPLGICRVTDNQIPYFDFLIQEGLAVGIGNIDVNHNWHLDSFQISRIITDSKLRRSLVRNSSDFYDLQGSRRIVDAVLKL